MALLSFIIVLFVLEQLLTGLKYSPHMKIHFVQNGEDVMNYKKWQIEKHIKTLRDANGL